jgi:hypothetical protein
MGGVTIALAGCSSTSSSAGSSSTGADFGSEGGSGGANGKHAVVLEASGASGATAGDVTYSTATSDIAQDNDTSLPWSKKAMVSADFERRLRHRHLLLHPDLDRDVLHGDQRVRAGSQAASSLARCSRFSSASPIPWRSASLMTQ